MGWARPGPLVALGQHSLVIYWVHIEIVYGRLTWAQRGKMSLAQASAALALLFAAMLALAYAVDPIKLAARSFAQRLLARRAVAQGSPG